MLRAASCDSVLLFDQPVMLHWPSLWLLHLLGLLLLLLLLLVLLQQLLGLLLLLLPAVLGPAV